MLDRWYSTLRIAALALLAAAPAAAWTPATQVTIAREAANLAPPDLARQIEKHPKALAAGAVEPFNDSDPGRHTKNPDGSGSLDQVILSEVQKAIDAIRQYQPFEEIVRRLGVVSHYVADANNPLATSASDADEGRYFLDFLRYAESAEPRFPLVFYGTRPALDKGTEKGIGPLLADTFRRGREVYPFIGMEYRRIGFASGIGRFDDRSTAFGVASVAFSHAVTDVSVVMRYIWITAGGADERQGVTAASGSRVLLLPRAPRK